MFIISFGIQPISKVWSDILIHNAPVPSFSIRGAFKKEMAKIGLLDQPADPPPPSPEVGPNKSDTNLIFILHFRLF